MAALGAQTNAAAKAAVDEPNGLRLAVALAAAVVLLMMLAGLLLKRRMQPSPSVLREVELTGPDAVRLSPAALSRGTLGPGRSRWAVRDGRLVLTGPAGSLLNGVPIDRRGDIVSTGDTVRLGGAEYRVRII